MEKKLKVPHVYALLLIIMLVCVILTYIIPAGNYEMTEITMDDGSVREVVDATTYTQVEQTPVGVMGYLSAVPKGLVESASIIFFIFIVGGSFSVLQDTGAIEAGLGKLTKVFAGKETLLIPIVMIAFSLSGGVIGMAEETLPFIPIMVSLCIALGFDSITGTAMVLMGAGAGFAGAFMNPFTVGVAQGIAGLPLFSGMQFRIIMFIIMTAIAIIFVMRYAKRIKEDPTLSSMHEVDKNRDDNLDLNNLHPFGTKEKIIMGVFVVAIVLLVYGVVNWGWYLNEISALFLGMAIIVSFIAGMGINGFAKSLADGMTSIAAGALIVGLARGILVVMTEGNIIHSILHGASNLLSTLPSGVTALGMYIFQCLLNVIIPSGSGQAAVSIPIMAPLSDLVGVTRQVAVVAFQLGDGISNILTPTSGYFMAGLALADIPWTKWAKWILPGIIAWYIAGGVMVFIGQMIGLGPF